MGEGEEGEAARGATGERDRDSAPRTPHAVLHAVCVNMGVRLEYVNLVT